MKKEKNDYYVYCWIDDKNEHKPFYVGKGKGLRAEAHDTLNAEEKKESIVQSRINELRFKGGQPYVRRFMWGLSNDSAHAVETALINTFDDLCNLSDGRALHNIRRKKDFSSWNVEYPGVDFFHFAGKLEFLDAVNENSRYFKSKVDAYQKAGSNHKAAIGSYHVHSVSKIKMWMGDVSHKKWSNTYDEKTGEICIDMERVLERHQTFEEVQRVHDSKYTLNKKQDKAKLKTKNHFLCFMKGLLPNDYVQFLGVYRDNWEESKKRGILVRERVSTKWRVPKE